VNRQWRDANARVKLMKDMENSHLLNALRLMSRRPDVSKYRALVFEVRRRGLTTSLQMDVSGV
jgi:hypothetical protein